MAEDYKVPALAKKRAGDFFLWFGFFFGHAKKK
jgi:hypothetical protein